jgi:TctA family transporter
MIITEEKKIMALFIFILAGFLGIGSLNLNLTDPLLRSCPEQILM